MEHFACIAPTGAEFTRFREKPKYAEGLYDLGNDVFAWMTPNGSWGESNAGLVAGDGASLLVDTLWDVKYTRTMLDAMKPVTKDAPIGYVVNTHADGDHFWGNQLVADAEIVSSENCRGQMLHVLPKSLLMLEKLGKLLRAVKIFDADKIGHWFCQFTAPYDFGEVVHTPPTRTFEQELVIDVGGRQVVLIEVGPAHTNGDAMVYVPDAKVLFAADILFIGTTPLIWAGPVKNWLDALDKILDMDVEAIVPGHGPVTDKFGVETVKSFWTCVEEQVRRRFEAGMTEKDAAFDIVSSDSFARTEFKDWNSPERMMVNVHTIYRNLKRNPKPPTIIEMINIFSKQALLAYRLPNAQPAIMRRETRKAR